MALFTIASGEVKIVQPSTGKDTKFLPVWRSPNELCYGLVSSQTNQTNVVLTTDMALWKDGTPTILSTNWPPEVRKDLLD